jgi:hypothetical protein
VCASIQVKRRFVFVLKNGVIISSHFVCGVCVRGVITLSADACVSLRNSGPHSLRQGCSGSSSGASASGSEILLSGRVDGAKAHGVRGGQASSDAPESILRLAHLRHDLLVRLQTPHHANELRVSAAGGGLGHARLAIDRRSKLEEVEQHGGVLLETSKRLVELNSGLGQPCCAITLSLEFLRLDLELRGCQQRLGNLRRCSESGADWSVCTLASSPKKTRHLGSASAIVGGIKVW